MDPTLTDFNIPAAKRFCQGSRYLLKLGPKVDFTQFNMNVLTTAFFPVFSAFLCKDKHWTLILEANEKRNHVKIYDPLGFHIVGAPIADVPIHNRDHIFITEALWGHYKTNKTKVLKEIRINGKTPYINFNHLAPFEHVFDALKILSECQYRLSIPTNLGTIQRNGYDCGPLTVYAAIIANKHTHGLSPTVQSTLAQLKNRFNITIQ